MTFFTKDYKPKKIAGAFNDKYVKYKSEGDEQLSVEEYIQNIGPHLQDKINDLRKSHGWKIQLIMRINSM